MNASLSILNLEDNLADAELNQEVISARWPIREFVRVDTRWRCGCVTTRWSPS